MPHPLAAVLVSLSAILCVPPLSAKSQSGQSGSAPQQAKAQADTAARKKTRAKLQKSPAEETTAARERRLQRECRGRTNAGACLGYARP